MVHINGWEILTVQMPVISHHTISRIYFLLVSLICFIFMLIFFLKTHTACTASNICCYRMELNFQRLTMDYSSASYSPASSVVETDSQWDTRDTNSQWDTRDTEESGKKTPLKFLTWWCYHGRKNSSVNSKVMRQVCEATRKTGAEDQEQEVFSTLGCAGLSPGLTFAERDIGH